MGILLPTRCMALFVIFQELAHAKPTQHTCSQIFRSGYWFGVFHFWVFRVKYLLFKSVEYHKSSQQYRCQESYPKYLKLVTPNLRHSKSLSTFDILALAFALVMGNQTFYPIQTNPHLYSNIEASGFLLLISCQTSLCTRFSLLPTERVCVCVCEIQTLMKSMGVSNQK